MLLIKEDLRWQVYVGEHLILPQNDVLTPFPVKLSTASVSTAIATLHSANICTGNYDQRFIELASKKKGKFSSLSGDIVAVLETTPYSVVDGREIFMTVRHLQCEVLLPDKSLICWVCEQYRSTLRALVSKFRHSSFTSIYVNQRFLLTPQKSVRSIAVKRACILKNRQLKRLRSKLDKLTTQNNVCVAVDDALNADIEEVIKQQPAIQNDDFKRIFWEQQVYISCVTNCFMQQWLWQVAASKAAKTGVRWHPLFVRWCLNIMLTSGKTYDIIRDSGLISLPSRRTLRDYTHWMKLTPGFNAEVINHLRREANVDSLASWQR